MVNADHYSRSTNIEKLLKLLQDEKELTPFSFMKKARDIGIYPSQWVELVKDLREVGLISADTLNGEIKTYQRAFIYLPAEDTTDDTNDVLRSE